MTVEFGPRPIPWGSRCANGPGLMQVATPVTGSALVSRRDYQKTTASSSAGRDALGDCHVGLSVMLAQLGVQPDFASAATASASAAAAS